MAPEVLSKGTAYDSSADWFSFGCMIYKLLKGFVFSCVFPAFSFKLRISSVTSLNHPLIFLSFGGCSQPVQTHLLADVWKLFSYFLIRGDAVSQASAKCLT